VESSINHQSSDLTLKVERMFQNVLVVCIGNICRSPMAEALLRKATHDNVHVHSAGIGALVGYPADAAAIRLMDGRGIDITGHRARQLSLSMVRESDLILVMDTSQQQHIQSKYPMASGKVHCIGKWIDLEIPDPYKKSPEYFASVLGLLDQSIALWVAKLWKQR